MARRRPYRDRSKAVEGREEANVELAEHVAHIQAQNPRGARELSYRQPVQVRAARVGWAQGGEGSGAKALRYVQQHIAFQAFHVREKMHLCSC